MTWAGVPRQRQCDTCLGMILSRMGENGEIKINWGFNRTPRAPQVLVEKEFGTGETFKVTGASDTMDSVLNRYIRRVEDRAAGVYTQRCHLGFHNSILDLGYLGIKATHYDGELSGIAQALVGARQVSMLAMPMDSKPAISTQRKLDKELAPPRSETEARDTCVAWVKGHKDIKVTRKPITYVTHKPTVTCHLLPRPPTCRKA